MRHDTSRSSQPARRRTSAAALLAALALVAASCGGGSGDAPPPPSAPSKDFKSSAKSTIDEKNMESELKKLTTEIDADSK